MAGPGIHLYTSKAAGRVQHSRLVFKITGAVTQVSMPLDESRVLNAFGAVTQASIDAHLGTSSEFTAAQYDATAMGADAQGLIIDMGGQADELSAVTARCYSGTAGATLVEQAFTPLSVLTDSTLQTECALGANGNIGIKLNWGNVPDFDALTAGTVIIDIEWRAK